MKNFIESGDQLEYTAGATHASGAVVRVGQVLGVNAYDVVSGEEGVIHFGVFTVAKVSGAVIAKGETLVWDASASAFDDNLASPATGDVSGASAVAWEAKGSGETSLDVKFTGLAGTVA